MLNGGIPTVNRNPDEADNDCGTHSGPVPVVSAAASGRGLVKTMTTLPPFFRYWGKTHGDDYHLLPYHALDVAAVACEYLKHHPRFRRFLAGALGEERL